MLIEEARRIALAAQGFARPGPAKATLAHLKRAFGDMALLQLDSVQYVCRSHYLPVFARVGPYDTKRLDRFTYESDQVLETWAHEASLVPMAHEPLLRWRKERSAKGAVWSHLHELAKEQPDYVAAICREVENRGPIHAGELEDPRKRKGSWWGGHSAGKIALEWMFRTGELCARRDSKFRRVYDLPERLIPAKIRALATPSEHEAHRELLMLGVKAHGIGSLDCLADYYRLKIPEARPRIAELVEDGRLESVSVEGWDKPAYVAPRTKVPKKIEACSVLSPFDPVVWNRKRAAKLFDFEYRIEIYVPKDKRKYGYYVLPFLQGDNITARVEVKADRKLGRLCVLGAWLEDGGCAKATAEALADSLARLAQHLLLGTLTPPRKGNLAKQLRAALS